MTPLFRFRTKRTYKPSDYPYTVCIYYIILYVVHILGWSNAEIFSTAQFMNNIMLYTVDTKFIMTFKGPVKIGHNNW